MKLPTEIWMCENEQARWFEFEQPYDLPNDVTVTKMVPEQPEPAPVAYGMWDTMLGYGGRMMMVRLDKGQDGCTVPLYTSPPQRTWVGLTDEERDEICLGDESVARSIEAKLREKNGGNHGS